KDEYFDKIFAGDMLTSEPLARVVWDELLWASERLTVADREETKEHLKTLLEHHDAWFNDEQLKEPVFWIILAITTLQIIRSNLGQLLVLFGLPLIILVVLLYAV